MGMWIDDVLNSCQYKYKIVIFEQVIDEVQYSELKKFKNLDCLRMVFFLLLGIVLGMMMLRQVCFVFLCCYQFLQVFDKDEGVYI